AYETGVANTIDPLAGSYFVESLTDQLEDEAEAIFAEIDELGGVVPGIETGYFQGRIARSARRFQDELEAGSRVVVGVNAFEEADEDHGVEILRIDESAGETQRRRLAELRSRRNAEEVTRALADLADAARNDQNLLPPMLDAVRAYATLGEIRVALEDVYGRFKEPISF
ncbi:MAG: methylmalonyl-CoA mutase family protein, partial [marine benthic group bacterium]|nr:methylmalonyl-CoA mutase family protein [Gemmatimonadota bacterium]